LTKECGGKHLKPAKHSYELVTGEDVKQNWWNLPHIMKFNRRDKRIIKKRRGAMVRGMA
jgi:hypothetical protein